jgi:hypothetical protein
MSEREQIWHALADAGIDNTTPTKDGKTMLEWMSESCPSLTVAVEFIRRMQEGDWR